MTWLTTPLRRAVNSPRATAVAQVLATLGVPVAVAVWLGSLGVTLVPRVGMSTSVAAALTVAVAAAWSWSLRSRRQPVGPRQLAALWLGATFLLPLWGDCATSLLVYTLGSWTATDGGIFLISLLAWGPVIAAAWRLVETVVVTAAVTRIASLVFIPAVIATIATWTLLPEGPIALWWQAPCAALLGAVCVGAIASRTTMSASPSGEVAVEQAVEPAASPLAMLSSGLGLVACGMLWPLLGRVTDQFVPATMHVVVAALVGLFTGMVVGRWLLRLRPTWTVATIALCGAILSVWVGAFPFNAEIAGWATSTLSQTTPLFAVRMGLAAVPVFVLGVAAAAWSFRLQPAVLSPWLFAAGAVAARELIPTCSTGLLLGIAFAAWALSAAIRVAMGLMSSVRQPRLGHGLKTGLPSSQIVRTVGQASSGTLTSGCDNAPFAMPVKARWLGMIPAAMVMVTAAGPWMVSQYRPDATARVLFSTTIFEGRRAGLSGVELFVLDEGRLIAAVDGPTGTVVAHRHAGSQWQLRKNGLPMGAFSTDPSAFPNFSGDVLAAAIPLALHAQPERVLVAGMSTTVPLSTALAFPVLAADCLEPDSALVAMHRGAVARERGESPLADERVRVAVGDPTWSLRTRGALYDVILSDPDYPVLAAAGAVHSQDFYRSAADRLTRDGIFAQRIRSVDLGPDALTTLIATAQNEFSAVMLFDTAPGEVLLVATSSPSGLIREGVVSRLQAGHLRQCLANCGMDWSMVLNLAAWSPDALMKLLAVNRPDASTAASPRLLFAMPNEAYAWTAKQQRLAALFTPHQGRLATLAGEDGSSAEVLRRLAEVKGQQDLMVKYGDEFWAYRKAVKEQVTHQPRTLMKDKSGKIGDTLHDEDRRRIQYFQSLKNALAQRDDASLARLESFERPYDPLLSFFVHAEAAEIAGRLTPRQPDRELRHRLHTIYFAPPATRSVRSVVEALRLVADFPNAVPTPQRRWEMQSALLSALSARWATRREITSNASPQLLSDLDTSLLLTRRTLDEMERTREEAGIPMTEWVARRRVLNRTLVSRLEQFRQTATLRTAPTTEGELSPTRPETGAPTIVPPLAN